MIKELLLLFLLILINAFFAATEIALISLNDSKIKLMADDGDKKAILIKALLDEPSRFLATIQIGITLAGFLASAFASESFADRIVIATKSYGIGIDEATIKTIAVIIITIILSYFTLVLGELVPKRLAMKLAEPVSMFAARPLTLLSKITSPFVKLLTISTNAVVKLFGVDPNADEQSVTEEEIRMMIDVGEEKGTIHKTEKVMINNIFEFNNKTVSDIMTHRMDIVALHEEATLEEAVNLIKREQYSRIPVYEDTIDNITGILHSKALFQYLTDNNGKKDFSLKNLVRPPYFVPSSKKTDVLFKEMQKNKTHMAIVIDEYGGTAGIVTMEDLVEEIVGNIFDEYDEEIKDIEKLDENTYIITGTLSLDTVAEFLKAALPVDEYETLSGFIIGQLGRIPAEDEQPEIEFNGFLFKVEEIEEKRIVKVKVCRAV